MPTDIIFKEKAREKLLKGVNILADAVCTTLSPKGRNVAINQKWGGVLIVHDGVTCAKAIELEDPFENMGANLIKEAASKTNDLTGDGTTTATCLAQAIVNKGLQNVTAGANPMIIKKGLEKGLEIVIKELEKIKIDIGYDDLEKIKQIANISSADKEIGDIVATSFVKVGKDGLVTAEEGKGLKIEVKETFGMEFENGYISPYFVTDTQTMEAKIENPAVIITDKRLSSIQEILPFLEKLIKITKNFVIIADDIEGETLSALVVNKIREKFNCIAIKSPAFGDIRKGMLEDIAILTGGKVISKDLNLKFEEIDPADYCGQCDSVTSTKDTTRIIGGNGNTKKRVAELKIQAEKAKEYEADKLRERICKLSGGIVIVEVGGNTEIEMKDKLERVKDAIGSTKSALEEGILSGGGVSLLRASMVLDGVKTNSQDEQTGIDILKYAIEQPIRKLAENCGADGGYVLNKIKESFNLEGGFLDYGYNAITGEFGSMKEMGIIDPVKVTKSALVNAVSVGMMILTTDVLITDTEEKKSLQVS